MFNDNGRAAIAPCSATSLL